MSIIERLTSLDHAQGVYPKFKVSWSTSIVSQRTPTD